MTLKLGKLQALAALHKQLGGEAAKATPLEQRAAEAAAGTAGLRELLHTMDLHRQARARAERAEQALAEARAALPAAERKISGIENPNPSIFPISREPAEPEKPPGEAAQGVPAQTSPPDAPPAEPKPQVQAQPAVEPGMPTEKRLPRSPQEANSLMEMARWGTPAVPQVQPTCDADREYLLKSGQLSSAEALKILMRRR